MQGGRGKGRDKGSPTSRRRVRIATTGMQHATTGPQWPTMDPQRATTGVQCATTGLQRATTGTKVTVLATTDIEIKNIRATTGTRSGDDGCWIGR